MKTGNKFHSENQDLAYFQQDVDIISGGVQIKDTPFYSVVTFVTVEMTPVVGWLKSYQLSSVPAMLRLYMQTAYDKGITYLPENLNSIWLPVFKAQGYSPSLTTTFLQAMWKLYNENRIPADIWSPKGDPRGKKEFVDQGTGAGDGGTKNPMSTAKILGIGAAVVVGGGALIFAMKGR
jgi:hypothetical protein